MNKIYINLKDNYRAILTETIPFETPIIFSNDGLYIILKDNILSKSSPFGKFLSKILNYEYKTEPYKYYIPKGDLDSRVISLVHPASQIKISEFLCENSNIITYFCTKSSASLRFPIKLSSQFYIKHKDTENLYKYRDGSKLNLRHDYLSLYSPSLFVYQNFNRLYKFINSSTFLELESRYSQLRLIDISKCFHNIYTHSISWATKNKDIIKSSLENKPFHFSDQFDKYMRAGNYDETHGIPIGAEYSRIFAEIIFQRIDNNIIEALNKKGILFNKDYTFKRYIDDIYIFSRSTILLDQIQDCITYELSLYNLHINHSKVANYSRPFITNKGIAFQEISQLINELDTSISERIIRHNNLKTSFINKIKSIVYKNNVSYSEINTFLISSISNRIHRYASLNNENNFDYRVLIILFEINFFFFEMAKNASISYIICKDILYVIEHREKTFQLLLKLYNLIKSFIQNINNKGINLEKLNMILITKIFPQELHFDADFICNTLLHENASYFDIITAIFYSEHNELAEEKIVNFIINKLRNNHGEKIYSSEKHHLILDIMSCPYISRSNKKKIYHEANLSNLFPSGEPGKTFFDEAEKYHIFTRWSQFSMHHFLLKKELHKRLLKSIY